MKYLGELYPIVNLDAIVYNYDMNNTYAYSAGLKQVRENWQTPPGTDADFVKDHLPEADEVIEYFKGVRIEKTAPGELFREKYGNETMFLWETPLQDVGTLDPHIIAGDGLSTSTEDNLKTMFRSMKGGDFKGAVSNGLLSTVGFYQTSPNGNTLDINSLIPNAEIVFARFKWYEYILRPSLLRAGMGIDGNRIHIMNSFFSDKVYREILTPAEILAHEAAHSWFAYKYPEVSNRSREFIITQKRFQVIDILSILMAFGVNGWYLLPSILVNAGGYIMSRDINTALGKQYHSLLANESHSTYVQAVFSDYIRRKGFRIGELSQNQEIINANFTANFISLYQPLPWGLFDLAGIIAGGSSIPKGSKVEKSSQPLSFAA